MDFGAQIIQVAKGYIGQQEKPGNKGFVDPSLEKKMRAIGWQTGWAWCALFCKLVYSEAYAGSAQASKILKFFSPMATACFRQAQSQGFKTSTVPVPGAVAVWKHGNGPSGHAGIVVQVLNSTKFKSVEGNTNDQGGREGIEVAEKVRTVDFTVRPGRLNLVGFIHPPEG